MKRDLGQMMAAAVPPDSTSAFLRSQGIGVPGGGVAPSEVPFDYAGAGKTLGLMGMSMAPGMGATDALGLYPNAEGGHDPSMRENWRQGNYGTAALQGLGAMGDAAYAIPLLGAVAGPALKAPRAAQKASKLAKTMAEATRSTQLTDISKLPREAAIDVARKQPHLIKAGNQSQGFYVGGPPEVNSKRGLTNLRNNFDAYVGADPRGADWYDRYRNAVTNVTGGDPQQMDWMTKTHGMMSAGVDPGSELQFALRENNGQVAGMPVKAARPAQHEALQAAIDARDPSKITLGEKTGEYARLIHPEQMHEGATGVNDFRYKNQWGYPGRESPTLAQHNFMDYETALAVDRANKAGLGGRSDWTGEQLQAAPWVRQKAEAIAAKSGIPYEEAFGKANATIADFFPKHTAFATHEALPGPSTGHLPDLPTAPQDVRDAYSVDPQSLWNNAPGGRDAIYSGLGVEGTGVNMRVQPSIDMQGSYVPEGMDRQFNLGQTARPLVAFATKDPEGAALAAKTVAPADRALLDTGELTRAYIDAQDAGAWHKPYFDGKAGASNSYFMPMDRPASPEELQRLGLAVGPHGLGDVVDTGQGITATSFYPGPRPLDAKGRQAVEGAITEALPGANPLRAAVDSGYADLSEAWKAGEGSGAATDKLLGALNQNPQLAQAFSNNPYIPANAAARAARDAELGPWFGGARPDIQRAREIIGSGPGWVERLMEARRSGVALPGLGAGLMAPYLLPEDQSGS